MFETNGNIVLSQVTFLMSGHFCFIPCSNWSSGLQKSVIIRPVCPAQTLSLKVSREEGWSSHDEYLRVSVPTLLLLFAHFLFIFCILLAYRCTPLKPEWSRLLTIPEYVADNASGFGKSLFNEFLDAQQVQLRYARVPSRTPLLHFVRTTIQVR